MVRHLFSIMLWFCLAGVALADAPRLTLSVDPTSGTSADRYTFNVTIDGASDAAYPMLSGGDDFSLKLLGPQSSVMVVNGKVSQRVTFVYVLTPKKDGLLQTPAAEVEVDGTKLKAEPLPVQVSAGPTAPSAQSSSKDPYFVEQDVSKTRAYVGEQLSNSVDIVSRVPLIEAQLENLTFDGFWSEVLGQNRSGQRFINGQDYSTLSIRRALFPLKSGQLTIPARTIDAKIRERQRRPSRMPFFENDPFNQDFFDDFFGNAVTRDIKIVSNPLNVQISELPPAPADLPHWGLRETLVGPTKVELKYDRSAINAQDSKTIEVVVESEGNLNPLTELPIKNSSNFKIYQETAEIDRRERAGKLVTTKRFKAALVPSYGGTLTIPPLSLGYFDPNTSSYQVASTEPISFEVEGPAAPLDTAPVSPALEASKGIEPTPAQPQIEPGSAFASINFSSLLFGICALLVLVLGWISFRPLLRRKAETQLQLTAINQACDPNALWRELGTALEKRLGLGANLRGYALKQAVDQALHASPLRLDVISLLDRLEQALFGGIPMDSEELSELRKRAAETLRKL